MLVLTNIQPEEKHYRYSGTNSFFFKSKSGLIQVENKLDFKKYVESSSTYLWGGEGICKVADSEPRLSLKFSECIWKWAAGTYGSPRWILVPVDQ